MKATKTKGGLITIYYPDGRYTYKLPWKSRWETEGMEIPDGGLIRLRSEVDIPVLRALLLTGGGWP